ncbi:zinc finger HIT domain-containing protein 2 isoform X1 [Eurytemora carolleeae]|uniref:zinc finger HIT domain-containing protein 2 isoform X1 n=1 Tax=Eurytemora carolleeae TaxID=1294199 RepID=UPI000C78016F|nr:zinc finger HIT domain-containing protein 2 isoform X1 [Eurytemora carolleeae]|eukprot:XP_023342564.1 zinc finger HIT domain-containing protein 2-like isoform X1 [Eurytemora affinis]
MHKMARKLSSFKVYYCFRKQWHPNLLEQILEMSRNCGFCTTGDGAFTCPRCNKDYCGLKCYQSINHQRCSEDFYKECVKAELVGDNLSDESKARMHQILQRMANSGEESDSDIDSDDDDDDIDLAERLKGIDLEDTETVWNLLSSQERREFNQLLEKGDVTNLLPEYTPWWINRYECPKIQELDAPRNEDYKKSCPAIWENIPKFHEIFSGKPSQFIQYGVLNLVYAFAYAVRFHYGDYSNCSLEFVHIVQSLANSLKGVNYDLADTAVEAAASAVNLNPHLAVSLEFSRSVKKDVYQIVKGPCEDDNQYYLLACLSELREQYKSAIKLVKSGNSRNQKPSRFAQKLPDLDPKLLKVQLKKIEFYLSWAAENKTAFSDM